MPPLPSLPSAKLINKRTDSQIRERYDGVYSRGDLRYSYDPKPCLVKGGEPSRFHKMTEAYKCEFKDEAALHQLNDFYHQRTNNIPAFLSNCLFRPGESGNSLPQPSAL